MKRTGTAAVAPSEGEWAEMHRVEDGGDDVERVMQGAFYVPLPGAGAATIGTVRKTKPSHYQVICISMYTRDLEELDAKVAELKKRGLTKASRSALIRFALAELDIEKVPRGI